MFFRNNFTNNADQINEVFGIHRRIRHSKSGWEYVGAEGSHYIYEKDGRRYPVPYHGAKEIGEGLRKKIMKDMGLK